MAGTIDQLNEAAKIGDIGRVRDLICSAAALAGERLANGESPLMSALYRGHRDIVRLLIERGAPLDLFAAAAAGQPADVGRALEAGAAVNDYSYDGWTALHLASFFGQLESARTLIAAGAHVPSVSRNSLKNTPLHAAAAAGHAPIALLLITRGADVNARDSGGHTPLHIAAENGLADVVEALLDRGADPLAVDGEDKTPLARAAARDRNAIIDLLNART
jgi:ankyrin repeat protein